MIHGRAKRAALLALVCGGALLTLGGCSTRSPVRALGDGLLQVDCPGGYHDWSGCLDAARRHCGDQGFRIEAEISDEGGSVGTRDWSLEGSEVSRTMEFRCGQ